MNGMQCYTVYRPTLSLLAVLSLVNFVIENELVKRDIDARDRALWFSIRDETETVPGFLETEMRLRCSKTASQD